MTQLALKRKCDRGKHVASWRIGVYLAVLSVISWVTVSTVTDPQGGDLNVRDNAA